VGVRFWEKVDPCLLADPYAVSGQGRKEVGYCLISEASSAAEKYIYEVLLQKSYKVC
jgi:hypothetical protein